MYDPSEKVTIFATFYKLFKSMGDTPAYVSSIMKFKI